MASNSSDGFLLDRIRDGVSERSKAELNEDAAPRHVEDDRPDRMRPVSYEFDEYDRTEAPKDEMRKYWRQFETTPIIRKPITSFSSRVTQPGYYVEAEELEEDEVAELGEWLQNCAIIEGMPGRDFRLLARKAITQREVRGTALVEKAPHRDDMNRVAGLKLINPEVCEAVTRPQQNILIAPDDGDRFPDAPEAESEGKAAWLQDVIEAREVDWGASERIRRGMTDEDDDLKVGFRRDEIVPLARDADVGEVFGTSRLESVSPRIEGLKQKLCDNDKAIESKAYPLWLFMFGDPETTGPWDSDMIDEFMSSHEMDNFHPGMKQGVRGDVSVETISGEVSDIAEYLDFDIQWIMSSMPMPMFSLGAFSEPGGQVGRVAGIAQQQNVNRQIKEARRELEEEFTPVVKQVAQQQGVDEDRAESIRLRFGNPSGTDPEERRSEQVIRYVSDADGGAGGVQQPSMGAPQMPSATPTNTRPQSGEQPAPQTQVNNPTPDQPIAGVGKQDSVTSQIDSKHAKVWDALLSSDELAHGSSEEKELSDEITSLLVEVRDRTLDKVEREYGETPQFAAVNFENIANRELNNQIRRRNLRRTANESFEQVVLSVDEEYGNEDTTFTQRQNVRFYSQTFENAVRDAAEEMLRRARVLVRDGVVSGENWSDVRERVELSYDDAEIRNRANIIAHMELKRAKETTKLQQFEADPEVVGVRVHNPDASARVTRSLHGEEAYFDEGEVDNQLAEQVREEELREGFNPLPRTPPYHFNDTTELKPIRRAE